MRGLDYYNRTVFEWMTDRLGAQGTVAGGGRYDGLFEQLGGKRSFACGFAIGIERMVLLLQEAGTARVAAPLAYVVHMSEAGAKLASRVGEMLRDAGNAIVVNAGGGSIKSQMKKADASGAAFALIIGDDEVSSGQRERQTAARRRRAGRRFRHRCCRGARRSAMNPPAVTTGTTERETRMAVYDIEEQEKLDDLKAWWNQWGNLVSGVVIAVALGVFAVQGWRWWQGNQAEQASVLFTAVSAAAKANDVDEGEGSGRRQLASSFGGTGYAPRAALLVSKLMFDAGDTAGATAQLQFVLDRASEDELKQIARIRLAEIQFETKQYDNALRTLDAKRDEPFAGVYEDLRGDILAAAGRVSEARTAYQTALTKLDSKGPYHGFVQAKLDAIGGPLTADAGKSEPMTPTADRPGRTRLRHVRCRRPLRRLAPARARPRNERGAPGISARLRAEIDPASLRSRRGGDRCRRMRRLRVIAIVDPFDSTAVVRLADVDVRRWKEDRSAARFPDHGDHADRMAGQCRQVGTGPRTCRHA